MRVALLAFIVACSSSHQATSTTAEHAGTTIAPALELAQVEPAGFVTIDDATPDISISADAISVRGQRVTALENGAPASTEISAGVIPKLRDAIAKLEVRPIEKRSQPDMVSMSTYEPLAVVAADKHVPYRTLLQVIASVKGSPYAGVLLLARSETKTVATPLWFRERATEDTAVMPVIGIMPGKLVVWSISGLEGTLNAPKLTLLPTPTFDLRTLGKLMAEIAMRHPATTIAARRLVLIADGTVAAETVLGVVGTARMTPNHQELFDIVLSSGFE